MTRYLNATQSLSLGEIGSLIFVSYFWIYGAIHVKSSSKMAGDIRKYLKKKSSSCNRKSLTSMLNSPFCFLSEYIFLSQNLFLYFPEFFLKWRMYSTFPINNLLLSRSWTKYVEPNFTFIFSICPLSFYDYGKKFISQWNYLNLWRLALCFPLSKIFAAKKVASCEKSRLVENRLKNINSINLLE